MELTPNEFMNAFGKRLKALRKLRGYTQQALCKKLSLNHNSVVHWEGGRNLPSLLAYRKLCLILDVPLDYFFEGKGEVPEA